MPRLIPALVLMALTGCSGSLDQAPEHDDDTSSSRDDAGQPGHSPDAGSTKPDPLPEADAGADDGEHADASLPPEGCEEGADAALDVTSISVSGPQGAPRKGDELTVSITLHNAGSRGARVGATVLLDGLRFDDFRGVPLATGEVTACPGDTTLTLKGGPFLAEPNTNRQFALGSGQYVASGVVLSSSAGTVTDNEFAGAQFELATSNVLLVPVLYNQGYFDEIQGKWESPEAYLREAYTRRNEVFTPTSGDPDGAGNFVTYEGGFDEMMGVRHVFKAFPGFDGAFDSGENWCYGAMDYASQVLGLKARWTGGGTRADQHGFDYVIALSSKMGGGVAWHPFDVQVSGFINRDVDRQQVIAVHESGHVFGAPHCDDVGNGSGGSLQGYVMCAGEKHEHYPSAFVWHSTSIANMSGSRWN